MIRIPDAKGNAVDGSNYLLVTAFRSSLINRGYTTAKIVLI
jgi:hypothetical protein